MLFLIGGSDGLALLDAPHAVALSDFACSPSLKFEESVYTVNDHGDKTKKLLTREEKKKEEKINTESKRISMVVVLIKVSTEAAAQASLWLPQAAQAAEAVK